MPLLVPLLAALAVVLGATMLWVWAGSVAGVRHGSTVALLTGALALAGLGVLIGSESTDAVPAWTGWALLVVGALALVGGWIALARWGQPRRR